MVIGNQDRSQAPVFVAGCPRSGTTLLYDMLLSSGGFAVYLTESNVFAVLAQRFGDLGSVRNRHRLMESWLGSKLFRASGLDAALIEKKILDECQNYGDFLRITMEEIARSQNAARWAENTPEHILYAQLIKSLIPNALFIHVIRDGRAVALSLDQRSDRGLHVLPWDRKHNLLIQGMYWDWFVRRARKVGAWLRADYLEVRFEELLRYPDRVLSEVSQFIGQKLDHERILEVGYRTVRAPNTSFRKETSFQPVDRWRSAYSREQLVAFESVNGKLLVELGYPLLTDNARTVPQLRRRKAFYRAYFSWRFRIKTSAIGRALRPRLTARELDEIVTGEDRPAEVRRDTPKNPVLG